MLETAFDIDADSQEDGGLDSGLFGMAKTKSL